MYINKNSMTSSYKKYIIILIVIYVIIYSIQIGKEITSSKVGLMSAFSSKEEEEKAKSNFDFNSKKCYPHMIPIAGFFEDAKGDDFISKTINNFNTCIFDKVEVFIKENAKPLLFIITFIKDGIKSIGVVLNAFRKFASFLRQMFMILVQSVTDKLKNSQIAAVYLQEKMRLLIRKQTAIFEILNQLTGTLPFLLHSFMYGPIVRFPTWVLKYWLAIVVILVICTLCVFGGFFTRIIACPICLICFTPDTSIDISSSERKAIKDIQIGENIKNNKVLGKIYILPHYADTYRYKGVNVTGSHLVFDKKWERIEDNHNSIQDSKNTDLYCLITDNNTIYSNNIKFRDYQETQDMDINLQINYLIASSLNNGLGSISNEDDCYHNYYWGFGENTLINLEGNYVEIKDIIKNPKNYNIAGIVEIHSEYTLYDYCGVEVSGNTLVNEDNIWLRVHQSIKSRKICQETKLYNIITHTGLIIARGANNDYIFRDFNETDDKAVNEKIDTMVENRLNLIFDFDKL